MILKYLLRKLFIPTICEDKELIKLCLFGYQPIVENHNGIRGSDRCRSLSEPGQQSEIQIVVNPDQGFNNCATTGQIRDITGMDCMEVAISELRSARTTTPVEG